MHKPWQVTIDLHPALGLVLGVREHTHGSVAFSIEAAEYCGGAIKYDEDNYITECRDNYTIVNSAREIAQWLGSYMKP